MRVVVKVMMVVKARLRARWNEQRSLLAIEVGRIRARRAGRDAQLNQLRPINIAIPGYLFNASNSSS